MRSRRQYLDGREREGNAVRTYVLCGTKLTRLTLRNVKSCERICLNYVKGLGCIYWKMGKLRVLTREERRRWEQKSLVSPSFSYPCHFALLFLSKWWLRKFSGWKRTRKNAGWVLSPSLPPSVVWHCSMLDDFLTDKERSKTKEKCLSTLVLSRYLYR